MPSLRHCVVLLLVMGCLYVCTWLYLREHPWSPS